MSITLHVKVPWHTVERMHEHLSRFESETPIEELAARVIRNCFQEPVKHDPVIRDVPDSEPDHYEIIVGNVGTVYSGNDKVGAERFFKSFVELSKSGTGRAANESVSLFVNHELEDEYVPDNDEQFDGDEDEDSEETQPETSDEPSDSPDDDDFLREELLTDEQKEILSFFTGSDSTGEDGRSRSRSASPESSSEDTSKASIPRSPRSEGGSPLPPCDYCGKENGNGAFIIGAKNLDTEGFVLVEGTGKMACDECYKRLRGVPEVEPSHDLAMSDKCPWATLGEVAKKHNLPLDEALSKIREFHPDWLREAGAE